MRVEKDILESSISVAQHKTPAANAVETNLHRELILQDTLNSEQGRVQSSTTLK